MEVYVVLEYDNSMDMVYAVAVYMTRAQAEARAAENHRYYVDECKLED